MALTGARCMTAVAVLVLATVLRATSAEDAVAETNALDTNVTDSPSPSPSPSSNSRQYSGNDGCPLCDASVYDYCPYKLIHDSCCCNFPATQLKPRQCMYFDCTVLYAKSCYEHELIKNCCCHNPY